MPDTIVVKQDPTPPAAPAQNQQTPPAAPDNQNARPSWLPEKFKTPEDMAKAYSELEREYTKSRQQTNQQQPPPQNQQTPPTNEQQGEQKKDLGIPEAPPPDAIMVGNVDVTKYNAEFAEKGALSDESYKELASKGFPKEVVDSFIQGQLAIKTKTETEIRSVVGGEEVYSAMIEWAKANLSPAEKAAYNEAMKSGNIESMKLAAAGLHTKYTKAAGSDPKFVNGDNTPNAGTDGFASMAQVKEAMADPRYTTDPAYRDAVYKRLAVSKF